MRKVNVAVLGATGAVGEALFDILEQRNFPVNQVFALASQRSVGKKVRFGKQQLPVLDVESFDFSQVELGLFSAGASISEKYAPRAAAAGCLVIDNTSQFRYEADIPLVVPEVNSERIADYRQRNIIANPNCSTIQMLVALKPIYDAVGIQSITVSTYQAVSGTGREAMEELALQTARLLNGQDIESIVYPKQIAFNLLPQIDVFLENAFTKEEMKMVWETRKILDDPEILVNPTAVRVPVFYGHSEAIHLETKAPLSAKAARELLQAAPGVVVVDDPATLAYPTPVTHAAQKDGVFVGRIRESLLTPNGLNLWVVSDNVRKGAALNSIQIAEVWLQSQL